MLGHGPVVDGSSEKHKDLGRAEGSGVAGRVVNNVSRPEPEGTTHWGSKQTHHQSNLSFREISMSHHRSCMPGRAPACPPRWCPPARPTLSSTLPEDPALLPNKIDSVSGGLLDAWPTEERYNGHEGIQPCLISSPWRAIIGHEAKQADIVWKVSTSATSSCCNCPFING